MGNRAIFLVNTSIWPFTSASVGEGCQVGYASKTLKRIILAEWKEGKELDLSNVMQEEVAGRSAAWRAELKTIPRS